MPIWATIALCIILVILVMVVKSRLRHHDKAPRRHERQIQLPDYPPRHYRE
jgi:hypothetical protein